MQEPCEEMAEFLTRGDAPRVHFEPYLLALVMDNLTVYIKNETPWYTLFADDVIHQFDKKPSNWCARNSKKKKRLLSQMGWKLAKQRHNIWRANSGDQRIGTKDDALQNWKLVSNMVWLYMWMAELIHYVLRKW